MLGFVQNIINILTQTVHPIGIDFGSDSLRLAQVQSDGDDFKLLAAASAELPAALHDDADARLNFFAETVRNLLNNGQFNSRRAVLGLPSTVVNTQHLALDPKLNSKDKVSLKEAILEQAKQKLPFERSHALIHYTLTKIDEHADDSPLHVVVLAADGRWVNQYLEAARKARLDIVGLNMQPLALIDCFSHVYRRASDRLSVRMYVDIGSTGTRATIAQGTRLLFVRNLPIGGNQITAAVAESLGISIQNARTLRLKLGAGAADPSDRVQSVAAKSIETLAKELDLCRTEHDSRFPHLRVQRLIFVGGEARIETLCGQISSHLKLPGQTGDSLCRMSRNSRVGIESTIDRRHPQPAWSAAVGLSFGPVNPRSE
jgi:type IV pilus assembly protein PilM